MLVEAAGRMPTKSFGGFGAIFYEAGRLALVKDMQQQHHGAERIFDFSFQLWHDCKS